jgi:hypothetical protein
MLQQHHEDLWTSRCLLSLGAVCLSRQMVIARLPDGGLWLHSPNEPTPAMQEALKPLGPVAWLVAPNCFHHRWLGKWKTLYPEATLIGAQGLAAKRSDLTFDAALGEHSPEAWGGAIESLVTEGASKLNEVVFFHGPSRTLVLTDFVFNQSPASGLPAFSRFMLGLMKAYGPLGPSRLFRMFTDDRKAVKRSIEQMLDRWPVERITMSHGEPLTENASQRLRAAYADW